VNQERLWEIEVFIQKRVEEYLKSATLGDDDIPPCTAEERWDSPAKFAVKKEGRKTAVRVLDTREEAEQRIAELGNGHYVEARPGESKKCQSYCICCEFCNYYQENVKPQEAAATA
jgi:hypothetical protein